MADRHPQPAREPCAAKAAALRTEAAAARALRRQNQQQITADEESFTAALRHAIQSMTSTQVTASSSVRALAAAADASARAALHTLNVPGRQRHSPRAQKARPKFPHASATKTTITGKTPGHGIRARLLITRGKTQ